MTTIGQAGLSLIELMIALAVGTFILLGLVNFAASSSRFQAEIAKVAEQADSARFTLSLLKDDVRNAGHYGYYYAHIYDVPTAMPDPCETDVTVLEGDLGLPIQGYENLSGALGGQFGNTSGTNCLTDAEHKDDSDILVVRRADTQTVTASSNNAQHYIQSTVNEVKIRTGANFADLDLTDAGGNPPPIRRFRTHIYYVSPCNVCAPTSDGIPTMKRKSLVNGAWEEEALAEGVEDLQISYGVDEGAGGGVDDGTANGFYTDPDAVTGVSETDAWAAVVTLRVFALVRNTRPTVGHTDTKVYEMGETGEVTANDATKGPFNDGYRRNNYSITIRVMNNSARRGTLS